MDAGMTAAATGLGASILVASATLVLLARAPAGPNRSLAAALMAVILSAAALMLAAQVASGSGLRGAAAAVSELLLYWSAAVGFHLNVSFTEWRGRVITPSGGLAVYLPMVGLSAVTGWGMAAFPASLVSATARSNPVSSFGPLDWLFLGTGALYVSGSIAVVVRALRRGGGSVRTELEIILAILVLQIAFGLTLLLAFPEVPGSSGFLMVGVLLGFVFSNAARKKSLFIAPESETPVLNEPLRLLSPGATYLFLREKEEARELLVLYLKSGRPGLWVTRRPPKEAREIYKLDRTPFIWLTSSAVPGENCLDPGDFGPLGTAITSFTRDAKDYLILIEGVEYIMTKTGFNTVLKLVQFLNDRVMSTGGILMLGLNPNAVKGNELALLKSEAAGVFEDAGPAANPGRVSRS